MKKIMYGILLAVLLVSASIYAYRWNENKEFPEARMINLEMHEEVQNVLETGTYEDLVALREKYDRPMMRWVQNEEDFELVKQNYQEKGFAGNKNYGNCPMMG